MDRLEPLAVDENVDVDGEPPKTVCLEGHPPGNGVGNTDRFQSASNLPQGLENCVITLKVPVALIHGPPSIAFQHVFVDRDDRSQAFG